MNVAVSWYSSKCSEELCGNYQTSKEKSKDVHSKKCSSINTEKMLEICFHYFPSVSKKQYQSRYQIYFDGNATQFVRNPQSQAFRLNVDSIYKVPNKLGINTVFFYCVLPNFPFIHQFIWDLSQKLIQ